MTYHYYKDHIHDCKEQANIFIRSHQEIIPNQSDQNNSEQVYQSDANASKNLSEASGSIDMEPSFEKSDNFDESNDMNTSEYTPKPSKAEKRLSRAALANKKEEFLQWIKDSSMTYKEKEALLQEVSNALFEKSEEEKRNAMLNLGYVALHYMDQLLRFLDRRQKLVVLASFLNENTIPSVIRNMAAQLINAGEKILKSASR